MRHKRYSPSPIGGLPCPVTVTGAFGVQMLCVANVAYKFFEDTLIELITMFGTPLIVCSLCNADWIDVTSIILMPVKSLALSTVISRGV